ncbi:hypothetical protein HMPREF9086_1523 [Enterobacter hormaechei ATCC 49162]|nr:hypothetical protein HMPREF9086_1523 [Enterobacter hormaechei ATCC 49162]
MKSVLCLNLISPEKMCENKNRATPGILHDNSVTRHFTSGSLAARMP